MTKTSNIKAFFEIAGLAMGIAAYAIGICIFVGLFVLAIASPILFLVWLILENTR